MALWTANKARLVQEYLRLFVLVTKHGTYLDGFSGAKNPADPQTWAASLVLGNEPRFLRHFHLFEQDEGQLAALTDLQMRALADDPDRTVEVWPGDFNTRVIELLEREDISENEATFCLLDQYTFQCRWATLERLARHKTSGHKIELFYFLANKWIGRAFAAHTVNVEEVDAWWGRPDWRALQGLDRKVRAQRFVDRFRHELGYRHVMPFPILERDGPGAPVVFYMIHATDHDAAPDFMCRAYHRAVLIRGDQESWPWRPKPPQNPQPEPDTSYTDGDTGE